MLKGGYVNHHIGFVPGAHKRSYREHVVVVRDLKLAPVKRVVILTIPFASLWATPAMRSRLDGRRIDVIRRAK
jgi:hypothetical protein